MVVPSFDVLAAVLTAVLSTTDDVIVGLRLLVTMEVVIDEELSGKLLVSTVVPSTVELGCPLVVATVLSSVEDSGNSETGDVDRVVGSVIVVGLRGTASLVVAVLKQAHIYIYHQPTNSSSVRQACLLLRPFFSQHTTLMSY